MTQSNLSMNKRHGHLKIFFSYASLTGKTQAMLKEGYQEKTKGKDVVVGFIHDKDKLSLDLEVLLMKENASSQMKEFDLELALKRKPDLLLIDNLAHKNAVGSRYQSRYMDIKELLAAGIDVYTTLNIQNIESFNKEILSARDIDEPEYIPDFIFNDADEIEFVDFECKQLFACYNKLKIQNYTLLQLEFLRTMALKKFEDRKIKKSVITKAETDEHILVCISSSPTGSKVIRMASRMAEAFHAQLIALYIETTKQPKMSDKDMTVLKENMHLARQLGARIEVIYGDDIAYQILEYSRLSHISKIVVGRSQTKKYFFFTKPTLVEQIMNMAPELDIYIIPVRDKVSYSSRKQKEKIKISFLEVLKTILILMAVTLIGYLFQRLGFSEANIITVYILGVLMTAIATTNKIYSLTSSIVSVFVFNFFFTKPHFTLHAYGSGYPVTFLIMFLAAFITSSLTVQIKQNAKQSAKVAYRTQVLLDTNQMLQKEGNKEGIIRVTGLQLMKLLERNILFYPIEENKLVEPIFFDLKENGIIDKEIDDIETKCASWVYQNPTYSFSSSDIFKESRYFYLSIRLNEKVYGIVGIELGDKALDSFENSIVLSILGEAGLAFESENANQEKAKATLIAKNEQLRANLLRSISHDLRTPLTSISGNAGILLANGESLDMDKKRQLYTNIYDDALWLINLVENLLSVTRIENGTMNLNKTTELIDEVINEALNHISRQGVEHVIQYEQVEEFILVKIDVRLIMQVIINIVDNAIKYTPKGSHIHIYSYKEGTMAVIEIKDDGEGVADEIKPHIFDMFYTGNMTVADSRRSLGLGLALCKSIINAHDGTIEVLDNVPHGAVFRFTLPTKEVTLHES